MYIAADFDFRPEPHVVDWNEFRVAPENDIDECRRYEVSQRWRNRSDAVALMPRHPADSMKSEELMRCIARAAAQCVSSAYLPQHLRGEFEVASLVVRTTPKSECRLRARADRPLGKRSQHWRASPPLATSRAPCASQTNKAPNSRSGSLTPSARSRFQSWAAHLTACAQPPGAAC